MPRGSSCQARRRWSAGAVALLVLLVAAPAVSGAAAEPAAGRRSPSLSVDWSSYRAAQAGSAVAEVPPGRVAGPSRFATSVAIAGRSFPDGADVVYLARGDQFADALAAGTLTDGPVLLVPSCGEPSPETAPEIARLDPDTVIALGGENAVCDQLLATLADGRPTDRLAADDRFGTAAAIATRAFPDGAATVYVANAADSPDAVAGGALTDGPILLVPADGSPPETVTATIDRLDPDAVIALGGTAAVADTTLAAAADGRPTDRLAGPSRFDTAVAIATAAFPQGADTVYLARGDVFADAVASGSLTDGPVLLVGSCGPLPDPVTTYLTTSTATTVIALGGTQAICDQVLTDAAALPDGDGDTDPVPSPDPTPTPDPDPSPLPSPSPDPEPDGINRDLTGTIWNSQPDGLTRLDLATGRVQTVVAESEDYRVSPDATEYLFARPAADTDADELVVGDIDGELTDVIPLVAEIDFGTGEVIPQFSPDGRLIAVELGFIPDLEELFQVLDRDGEPVIELEGVLGSAWTPDGRLVLTGQPGSAEVPGVYLVDLEGNGRLLREFPEYEGSPTRPAVSPDGSQIAYTYEGHLYLLPIEGGDHEQLTIGNTSEDEPAWSPDSESIAFQRDGICPELWVVPTDAGLVDVRPADEPDGTAFRPVDDTGRTFCAFTHIDWR